MKEVMKTNIYDVEDTIIIVGSCLKQREPEGFEKYRVIQDKKFESDFDKFILEVESDNK